MKLRTPLYAFILFTLSAFALAGCGGGGGGGGGVGVGNVGGVALQPLVIDQDNAMQVAAAVLDAVAIVQDLGSGSVVPPIPVAATAGNFNALPPTLTEIIRDQIDRFQLLRTPQPIAQVAAVEIPPTTFECIPGGTFTISGEIADETGTNLTPGDTLRISFSECDDGDGVVINGKLALVVVTGVDTDFTPPYDFTFNTTLTNFSVTESGETFTANGDLTLREAVTADGLFIETEASGNRLTAKGDGETETLKDYWIRGTLDVAAGDAYTVESSGLRDCCATLESTLLGGTVDFENIEFFAGVGDNFPYVGVLFITGAIAPFGNGDTSVELIALDELCVNLFIDENGDGGVDAGITTTWESLPTGIPVDCVI
jgi:hypothetical protein